MKRIQTRDTTQLSVVPLKTAVKDHHPNLLYRRNFHIMAKPCGSQCNMDCKYCFYLHKSELLHQNRHARMDNATLEKFIRDYINSHDSRDIVFSWQGGEPTLLGLDYFQHIVELQKRYKPEGVNIHNDLQTNGLLINDAWCEFLAEHHFLVGLSIDGTKELHDRYRITRSGKPTFDKVMGAVEKLRKYHVSFNALTVVNNFNSKHPLKVYNFLTRELGVNYIQFTPCVEPKSHKKIAPQFDSSISTVYINSTQSNPSSKHSIVTPWSVASDDWGQFLISIFTEWVNNDLGRVQVNLFESAVAQTMGLPAQVCVMSEFCGKALAIEYDGALFSCDHFVYPEYQLGNIHSTPLNQMVFSIRQEAFGMSKRDSLPDYCMRCPHLRLCWGECPKNRLLTTPDGEEGLNYLCSGFKAFFNEAAPILVGIAANLPKES